MHPSGRDGLIESLNDRLRDDLLNVHKVATLHDVREKMEVWRVDAINHGPPWFACSPDSERVRQKKVSSANKGTAWYRLAEFALIRLLSEKTQVS